jgi:multiple antibiotic resistance protein
MMHVVIALVMIVRWLQGRAVFTERDWLPTCRHPLPILISPKDRPVYSILGALRKGFTIDFIATVIFFFAVIDPIGTVPVFIAFTSQHDERMKRRVAVKATVASAAILVFFVVAGEIILTPMDIPILAFQIAGGIVLFLFALSMIFAESKAEKEVDLTMGGSDTAIFPIAVPSIAGPGAMLTAVLLTENARYSLWEQAQTTAAMLAVLLVVFVFMLGASWIHRFIGTSGASIVSRVMGLILASVATANALAGIKEYFAL